MAPTPQCRYKAAMTNTPLNRLRLMGMIEGLSFLALLFIAMPLKYIYGDPSWVKMVGQVHGMLWIGFCFVLWDTKSKLNWTLKQAMVPFIAAVLPFGPFLIDRKLRDF
jgi:integral membrane protein